MDVVKSYRVTRSKMKVGDRVFHYGDLLPEAGEWKPRVLTPAVSAGYLEEIWIDEKVQDEALKKQKAQQPPEEVPQESSEDSQETQDAEETQEVSEDSASKSKKTVKTRKKAKSNG